jgi:hypothetical protein
MKARKPDKRDTDRSTVRALRPVASENSGVLGVESRWGTGA